ncbi:MAG: hypothetical protein ABIE42_09300 [Candidatus Eisenbacteria bacterium]
MQKTVPRGGLTSIHGEFNARETIHVCASRCRYANGALVIRRAAALQEALIPLRSVGYDVMALIGIERYLHHRQREEIQDLLLHEHGLSLSTGTISDLAHLFCQYLHALHEAHADELSAALDSDGGYPLHIDATGESGRGTLLIAYAGWRQWVLGAWKIPTERADAVLPRLREVVGHFGPPIAIVRDLGRAMIPAAHDLVAELEQPIPILSCHAHFLADVGKDLLKESHGQLRKLFRDHKVRPGLRDLVREIGRKIGVDIAGVRGAMKGWQALQDGEHTLPQGNRNGLGVVRSLAQWVLDYPADSTGADFPFDRPYLDLLDRCVRVRRAVDAFLRKPPEDKEANRALRRLGRLLEPVSSQRHFLNAATTLRRRAGLFDELRTTLRLHSSTDADTQEQTPETAQRELQDVQTAVDSLYLSLQDRRPQRGPAQDSRQAIDLILTHLDRYGDSLWGHVIALPAEAGGGIRLVARTNNLLEGFNRSMKQGERRRSGRKTLSDDFEHLPPEAALARNLLCADYVEIICGSVERLPEALVQLDANRRRRALETEHSDVSQPTQHTPEIASASLPKEDRRIVRSEAMALRIIAAAGSRAPKVEIRPAQY